MNSIAYIGDVATVGRKLQSALEAVHWGRTLIVLRTLAELTAHLSKPNGHPEIIILLTTCQEELERIIQMKTLLRDRKIILILPDDSREAFAQGCLIFPRFICDLNSNFLDVAAVLEKLTST